MDNKITQSQSQTTEPPTNLTPTTQQETPIQPPPKSKTPIIIGIVILFLLLVSTTAYFAYTRNVHSNAINNSPKQNIADNPPNPSDEQTTQHTTNVSEGMAYQDPCETGDTKGCIMKEAYSKLSKSSLTNYTIIWSEAFKVCENYPSDQSILFSVEQCKLDICQNLHLGDGNIKYAYPETEQCEKEVISICPDGNILESIPCSCNYRAGPHAAFTEEWLNNYWNKYRKNDPPIYCCSGEVEDSPCSSSTQ